MMAMPLSAFLVSYVCFSGFRQFGRVWSSYMGGSRAIINREGRRSIHVAEQGAAWADGRQRWRQHGASVQRTVQTDGLSQGQQHNRMFSTRVSQRDPFLVEASPQSGGHRWKSVAPSLPAANQPSVYSAGSQHPLSKMSGREREVGGVWIQKEIADRRRVPGPTAQIARCVVDPGIGSRKHLHRAVLFLLQIASRCSASTASDDWSQAVRR